MITKTLKSALKLVLRSTIFGFETGPIVERYTMYERIKEALRSADSSFLSGRILSVSYSNYLASLIKVPTSEVIEANYPQHDLLNLSYANNSFDYVVADQVLEHIAGDPLRAVEEARRVLKPGGIAIFTTCLLYEVHDHPGDYWRFTPYGLELLCRGFSRVIQCEGWGNKLAFTAFRFYPTPTNKWHPLNRIARMSDPEVLISTWFVAQK